MAAKRLSFEGASYKPNKNMENQPTNLLEYVYSDQDTVTIPGTALYGLLQFLNTIKENETHTIYSHQYVLKGKEVFDTENKKFLTKVEQEFKTYPNGESFFAQQPILGTTQLGAVATDLLLGLQSIHLENINNQVAKKVGVFSKETEGNDVGVSL